MAETPSPQSRRTRFWTFLSCHRVKVFFGVVAVVIAIWQVLETEFEVRRIRSEGFSDVVIESTRNHGYFPLVGAIAGSAIAIAVERLLKRVWGKRR